MRSASVRVVAALALCGSWSLTACAQSPLGPVTGEVSFHTRSADLGLGYTWGNGVLTYGGRTYPFSVKEHPPQPLGIPRVIASARYNLQRIEDFQGTFWALSGEATVGRGVSGVLMENDNGVRIRLDYTRSGARFAASPSRLTVHLLKPAKTLTDATHSAPAAH